VIGDPVEHSLSPAIHNAAFAAVGLDWRCVALAVRAGDVPAALSGVRALGLRGLSVTMPHKAAVIDGLDRLSPAAGALGSVNCIVARDGLLIGENTDGEGFVRGVQDDFGWSPEGAVCVVLGAGGAARAVVRALAGAGAAEVVVVNRSAENARTAAELAGDRGRVGDAADVARAELVVNATPVGMGGDATVPLDPELLDAQHLLAELIYHPPRTALMTAAAARGARTANGISMLVHQAAVAFERWTGVEAPVGTMRSAASAALSAGTTPA
jgi:shikimate dehydrogenase